MVKLLRIFGNPQSSHVLGDLVFPVVKTNRQLSRDTQCGNHDEIDGEGEIYYQQSSSNGPTTDNA